MTHRRSEPASRGSLFPVYVPDTTTPGVLVAELLLGDGPHSDYADQWVRVGGLHASVPHHPVVNPSA